MQVSGREGAGRACRKRFLGGWQGIWEGILRKGEGGKTGGAAWDEELGDYPGWATSFLLRFFKHFYCELHGCYLGPTAS